MSDHLSVALHVLALTGDGVQCATPALPDAPFWLPRNGSVVWVRPPAVGGFETCPLEAAAIKARSRSAERK
jgi:hypothetical protein